MKTALVNTNRSRPPIGPIGLDYTAEALAADGHEVSILDLCWAEDVRSALSGFLAGADYDLIGVSLRNTDDCVYTSRISFLWGFKEVVEIIKANSSAFIVLGGGGFSTMPREIFNRCGADAGIWGDGEFVLPELAVRLEKRQEWRDLPGLLWGDQGGWSPNPPEPRPLDELPPMTRSWIDNRRYFREGGQAGIETKRGCPNRCVYCADPVIKGRTLRTRPPRAVADEVENLLRQEIDSLHTCDSEFNLPYEHAVAVCRELINRGLGEKVRWYAYCAPVPFTPELAQLMRRAGCAGINFGVDNGDADMLERLGRDFTPEDIPRITDICRREGMSVMLDLLLGSPGESRESINRTVDLIREAAPDRAGVSAGVRIFPGTGMWEQLIKGEIQEGVERSADPLDPLFFMEPEVSGFILDYLNDIIGDDTTFLFFDPPRPESNYNYNANQLLEEAIAEGHRGAYWDILRLYGG
jgi:radical SAM superfamily enzyme YgiQ (UPF0313 family)